MRYIRITDIDENGDLKHDWKTAQNIDSRFLLEENDVLFARSGATVGKTFLYRKEHGKAIFAGYMIRFRVDESLIKPEYLFYYTQTSLYRTWVQLIQRPSGQPNINAEEFKSLEIPLPPLDVQAHIVEIMQAAHASKRAKEAESRILLESIDGYVLSELGITLPEEERETLFRVPFSRVQSGRFDPYAWHPARTQIVENIGALKYDLLPLKQIVEFRKTILLDNPEDLPYVGLENIESNTGIHINSSEAKASFGTALQFQAGDVLFPKLRPYLNKVYLAEWSGICSTEFHILHSHRVLNSFLSYFLRSQAVVRQTSWLSSGNTLPRLQSVDVQNLLIPLPPLAVQERIAAEAQARRSQAKALEQEAVEILAAAKVEVERMILGEGA